MTNLKDEYTAAEDINDVRQLLKLVKARPAVKKSGERGTLIAYSELTMMEKRLNHAIEMLVKITDEKIVKRFEDGDDFRRPLGASPSHFGFTVELIRLGMFEIKEGTAHRALCTSFAMVMEWFKNNTVSPDFSCIGFSLDKQPYKAIYENNS